MLTSRGRAQRHLPWGSVPLDEISFEDRCAGLPPRHLPLSGFLTLSAVSSPRRLVALFHATSVHRLPAFRAFSARSAVAPLGAPCSPAVTYSVRRSTEVQQRSTTPTPEPCSNRAADTRRDAINAPSNRCSPGLSPLRGFPIPVAGPSPPLTCFICLRMCKHFRRQIAPQGVPSGSGGDYWSRLNLHEVSHLVSSPRLLRPPASRRLPRARRPPTPPSEKNKFTRSVM